MVQVECRSHNRSAVYHNHHRLVANTSLESVGNETEDRLSVFLFLIDSTSLTMVQRNMPRTLDYLTRAMKALVFRKHNVVGGCTTPNMVAMLTGKRLRDDQPGMQTDFQGVNVWTTYFDDWPLIWKDFKKQGHVTWWSEEMAYAGTFHYLLWGFSKKPVDHCYRPWWIEMDLDKKRYSPMCYAGRPTYELETELLHRYFRRYDGKLKFGVTFLSDLSHDDCNNLEFADETLFQFIKKEHEMVRDDEI